MSGESRKRMPMMASAVGAFWPGRESSAGRRSFRFRVSRCSRNAFQRSFARASSAGARAAFSGCVPLSPSWAARGARPAMNAPAQNTNLNNLVIFMSAFLPVLLRSLGVLRNPCLFVIIGAQDIGVNVGVLLNDLGGQFAEGLLRLRDLGRLVGALGRGHLVQPFG